MGVAGFADFQRADVVAADAVQEDHSIRSFSLENAHVRHIEQSSSLAASQMFFNHRGVPDWHIPTRKGDDFSAQSFMRVIKRVRRGVSGSFSSQMKSGSDFPTFAVKPMA